MEFNISKGALVAAACGEALGAPIEFMSKEDIAATYGEVRDIMRGGAFNWDLGEATDDIDMLFAVSNSIIEDKKFSPETVAKNLLAWYNSHPKDIGTTTIHALLNLSRGIPWDMASNLTGKGNGALVRSTPLVIYSMANNIDIDTLANYCNDCGRITHANKVARWCSIVFGITLRSIFEGSNIHTAVGNGISMADKFVPEAKVEARSDIPSDYYPSGTAPDTLFTAIKCVESTSTLEDAVIKSVNLGMDTDSVGSVTGALAGAMYGFSSVPKRWIDSLYASTLNKIDLFLDSQNITRQTL
jgi:ADP-ribosyl-[dinitrogen reductase] hydrolase